DQHRHSRDPAAARRGRQRRPPPRGAERAVLRGVAMSYLGTWRYDPAFGLRGRVVDETPCLVSGRQDTHLILEISQFEMHGCMASQTQPAFPGRTWPKLAWTNPNPPPRVA